MISNEPAAARARLAIRHLPPARHGPRSRAPQMGLLARFTLAVALALASLGVAAQPALAANIIHIVQPGEDLYRIGLAYGISWQAIMAANSLYSTTIYVGEALVIPDSAAAPAPQPAPQPAAPEQPAAPVQPAAPATGRYMIQRGDTLWLVARRFQVSVDALMTANGIRNANYIYYGQVLVIPGQGSAAEGKVLSVAGRAQALPLDCESRSAVDWAGYFGVSIGEMAFLGALPASDDPDVGFVGDARGQLGQTPPSDYGVHAGPVADLLRAYGVSARAARGLSWDAVRAEIDADRPVMVWVVGQVGYGTAFDYTAPSTGHTSRVVPFEHTVLVIGYGADTVTILDGGTTYTRSLAQFQASWGALGDMAVLWQG